MLPLMHRLKRNGTSALCCFVALALSGCAPSFGNFGGKVIFKDKPLTGGQVSFIPKTGGAYTFDIKPDGSYSAEGIPAGEVIVVIIPPPPPPQADDPTRSKLATSTLAPQNLGVSIPPEYTDPSKTPLRHTVQAGAHTHDIKFP